jgi:hypothetical protein
MSIQVNAVLYYGIRLPEFEATEENDYGDKANALWDDSHAPTMPNDTSDYKTPEWDAWRQRNKGYESTPEHVRLTWFGAEDYETYCVLCPCLTKSVHLDKQIDLGAPVTLERHQAADVWLHEFCEKFNLPYKQPTWHLAAHYW